MNYYSALKSIHRYFVIPNGYHGNSAICGLSYCPDSRHAIAVTTDAGCFGIGDRAYQDMPELLYYFDNHRFVHFRQITRIASDREVEIFRDVVRKHYHGEIAS